MLSSECLLTKLQVYKAGMNASLEMIMNTRGGLETGRGHCEGSRDISIVWAVDHTSRDAGGGGLGRPQAMSRPMWVGALHGAIIPAKDQTVCPELCCAVLCSGCTGCTYLEPGTYTQQTHELIREAEGFETRDQTRRETGDEGLRYDITKSKARRRMRYDGTLEG